jgi:hypothetical protein
MKIILTQIVFSDVCISWVSLGKGNNVMKGVSGM